jgi:hypothetical protein
MTGLRQIRRPALDRASIDAEADPMGGHLVRSAGRPPWFLGTTTGTGCLVAGWQLQHSSLLSQLLLCAYALLAVTAGCWRLYLQIQADQVWLCRLRAGAHRKGRKKPE